MLEDRVVRAALPAMDGDAIERIELAARDCADAARRGDIATELAANRQFHFGIMDRPDQMYTLRLIRLLWDSTEAYRTLYYNSGEERAETVSAHDRILAAVRARDPDAVIAELGTHRDRALGFLLQVLTKQA